MASQFKTIGILGRIRNPGVIETLKALIHFLTELKQNLIIEAETAHALQDTNLKQVNKADLSNNCDLLIVVGGSIR